jgi:hypothetical protein
MNNINQDEEQQVLQEQQDPLQSRYRQRQRHIHTDRFVQGLNRWLPRGPPKNRNHFANRILRFKLTFRSGKVIRFAWQYERWLTHGLKRVPKNVRKEIILILNSLFEMKPFQIGFGDVITRNDRLRVIYDMCRFYDDNVSSNLTPVKFEKLC